MDKEIKSVTEKKLDTKHIQEKMDAYEIADTKNIVYMGNDLPNEYTAYGWYRYDSRFAMPAYVRTGRGGKI